MTAAGVRTRIAHVTPATAAEGPGTRFAVWFQGCPLRCPGCCNPEFLSFNGGRETTVAELADMLPPEADGITLLGGEPFAHAEAGAALADIAHSRNLSVMVFTGYTLEQLRESTDPFAAQLLATTDILVDGPYDRTQPDTARRWIGSTNQRIHFLSDRHRADDACWKQRNTLEIRVRGKEISVNGFPAADARGLWAGWKRRPTP